MELSCPMYAAATASRQDAGISESRLQASVDGAGARRTQRARVGERRTAIGEVGKCAGVEKRAEGRIAIVEDIVDAAVELERLVDLIRGMHVEDRIGRQPGGLVGFVADQILGADEQ